MKIWYFLFWIFLYQSKILPGIQKSYLEHRAIILKMWKYKNQVFLNKFSRLLMSFGDVLCITALNNVTFTTENIRNRSFLPTSKLLGAFFSTKKMIFLIRDSFSLRKTLSCAISDRLLGSRMHPEKTKSKWANRPPPQAVSHTTILIYSGTTTDDIFCSCFGTLLVFKGIRGINCRWPPPLRTRSGWK